MTAQAPGSLRVLGVDPGSRATGFGVVERRASKLLYVDCGVIRPAATATLADRLLAIYQGLARVIEQHRPDAAVVESVFAAKNAQSALKLGHARGVALLALAAQGVPIAEFTPGQIKRAVVGGGRADKHQVQQMVKVLLGLDAIVAEDASDALAGAICRCQFQELPAPAAGSTAGGWEAVLARRGR
jgi:crossover junction endodeoxyribonuclease RuvC